MAISDSLAISSAAPTIGSGSNKTYVTIKRTGQETERIDDSTDISAPTLLKIRHQVVGTEKQKNIIDRHNVVLSKTERDADGVAHEMSLSYTITVPRSAGLFSTTEAGDLLKQLINFLYGSGVHVSLLRGES